MKARDSKPQAYDEPALTRLRGFIGRFTGSAWLMTLLPALLCTGVSWLMISSFLQFGFKEGSWRDDGRGGHFDGGSDLLMGVAVILGGLYFWWRFFSLVLARFKE